MYAGHAVSKVGAAVEFFRPCSLALGDSRWWLSSGQLFFMRTLFVSLEAVGTLSFNIVCMVN